MTAPPLIRILFVEDDPDIQTIACLGLKAVGGFTVEVCSSGSEAIQKAPTFAPDLILLDVMMPGMDGMTTLKALRELPQTLSTPVIFLTAKVQTHEVAYYKQLGVLDVIAKPFDPMTLSVTLNRMWSQYHD
ncbi:response regulator [Coleofasciculus sp. FACHB-1120]|uniref:response regulator n=1 Tax=Coleofasciculus sp. FACHB-1120 TaxID=2692783 RepID=UPI0016895067|nr:response regulator [Coleofasciculus sp. FACHB-1120]MBD2743876.1 response regulator [Coleofasciculus sp. FACHB-1120]